MIQIFCVMYTLIYTHLVACVWLHLMCGVDGPKDAENGCERCAIFRWRYSRFSFWSPVNGIHNLTHILAHGGAVLDQGSEALPTISDSLPPTPIQALLNLTATRWGGGWFAYSSLLLYRLKLFSDFSLFSIWSDFMLQTKICCCCGYRSCCIFFLNNIQKCIS